METKIQEYKTIIETTHDGFWISDESGRLLEVNDTYCQMSGYSREELLTMDVPQLEAGESVEEVASHISRVVREGFGRFETLHRKKSGEIYEIEVSATYNAQTKKFISFLRDISTQKQHESLLRERLAQFQLLRELGITFAGDLDLGRLISKIVKVLPGSLGISRVAVFLYDEKRGGLVNGDRIEGNDISTRPEEAIMSPGESISGLCYSRRQPVVVNNCSDTIIVPQRWVKALSLQSTMAVPMIAKDKVLGVLRIDDTERINRYSEIDVMFFSLVADQLAVLIENSLLYSQAKRIQAELQSNEERIRTIFNSVNDAIAVVDTDSGTILDVNKKLCEISGYSTEECQSLSFAQLSAGMYPSTSTEAAKWFRKVREEGPQIFEWQIRKKSQEIHWVEMSMQMATIGSAERILVAMRDISERKAADQLRHALFKLAQIALTAPDLQSLFKGIHHTISVLLPVENFYIALFTKERNELSFPYFVDQYDAPPEPKPLGRGLTDYVIRTGRPLLASPEVFNDLVARGEVESIGAPSVDWIGVPLRVEDTILGVMVAQSYTEGLRYSEREMELFTFVSAQVATAIMRRHDEQLLRDSEARWRTLMESAPSLVHLIDRDGRILYINQTTAGFSRDQVIGSSIYDYVNDETATIYRKKLTEVFDDAKVVSFEVPAAGPFGSQSWFAVTVGPVRSGETIDRAIMNSVDVTEHKQTEEALLQAQKMESIGVLAGGVAHDFNNLLQAMLGQTYLAQSKLEVGHPARDFIEKAQKAATRAASLTQMLLAYSGRSRFDVKPVDLNTFINENVHLLKVALPKNVELNLHLAPGDLWIEADVAQIQQVVMNLLINGAESMEGKIGSISVTTIEKSISWEESLFWRHGEAQFSPGQYVMLEVSDTGCGMTPETLKRIFDPFYTTKFSGRGLGLAAVLGIVRSHRGGLQVESTPQQGTTFRIVFPVSSSRRQLQEPAQPHEKSSSVNATLLLIDDEEVVREVFADMVSELGFRLHTSPDGEKGLETYRKLQSDIDLVILDLSMPGIDGEETFRRLREINPNVKVLLSSGYTEEEITKRFAGMGLTGFIQKPYRWDTLSEQLQQYLQPKH